MIFETILIYICSLVLPYFIALASLELKDIGSNGMFLNNWSEFRTKFQLPALILYKHYLADRKRSYSNPIYRLVLHIWRLILSLFYMFLIVGFATWAYESWMSEDKFAGVIMFLLSAISIWHLWSAWQFGRQTKSK